MSSTIRFLFIIVSLLTLSGCISREKADERLARGCAAGAELFLESGYRIKEITKKEFSNVPELGKDYRAITLHVVESDDFANIDKEYICVFAENISFFSYNAVIYQLKLNGKIYGREGNNILGSFEDHLKLTEKVDNAINQ